MILGIENRNGFRDGCNHLEIVHSLAYEPYSSVDCVALDRRGFIILKFKRIDVVSQDFDVRFVFMFA